MHEPDPLLLDGTGVADAIKAELRRRITVLAEKGITPCLATILVGEDPASATYVRMKGNACRRLGMLSRRIDLPAGTDTSTLLTVIGELNRDPAVHGVLLQHPVPPPVDERAAFDAIDPAKDVDGVTSAGFGRAAFGLKCHQSCTPEAIVAILDYYGLPVAGKHAVVIGRSAILGKPMALLLLGRNATVTICHSHTEGLAGHVQRADIVVAAVGRPKFVQGDWIKPGAVVLDAGSNAGNVGDVDFAAAAPAAGAITPVPGGVGPVTIATLLKHTVDAAEALAPRKGYSP